MTLQTGFIGIGAMGFPMTRVLAAKGVPVTVWDVNPQQSEQAVALDGVVAADSIAEVVSAAEVIFTCLPNDQIVAAGLSGRRRYRSGGLAREDHGRLLDGQFLRHPTHCRDRATGRHIPHGCLDAGFGPPGGDR